jgi:hypothetical protein
MFDWFMALVLSPVIYSYVRCVLVPVVRLQCNRMKRWSR